MYRIRRCKECYHPIHIRTKGNKTIVNDICEHFRDIKITRATIDKMCIPIRQYREPAGHNHEFPRYCIIHGSTLKFRQLLKGFTSLYSCPDCKRVDKLLPKNYTTFWMKRTHNLNWVVGDVKRIVSPSYDELKKMGML